MVTEKVAYIGECGASGGAAVRVTASCCASTAASTSTIREQLQAVFERDWSSQYSADISDAERVGDRLRLPLGAGEQTTSSNHRFWLY
uniref:Uncharacterized protein n=1 Tax=Aquila chrysaetos chrysaetos TaxID=223781 RepID=A0A663FJC7_AQUCH